MSPVLSGFLYNNILSKLRSCQPISLCLVQCEYFLDVNTIFAIPHHFLPVPPTEAPVFSSCHAPSNCICFFFSELRKQPFGWFTVVLRGNTSLQSLPTHFQYSAPNTVYFILHILCIFKLSSVRLPYNCGKLHFISLPLSQPSRSSTRSWMISQTSSVWTMPLSTMASANFNFMSTLLIFVPKPFLKIKKEQLLWWRAEDLCF